MGWDLRFTIYDFGFTIVEFGVKTSPAFVNPQSTIDNPQSFSIRDFISMLVADRAALRRPAFGGAEEDFFERGVIDGGEGGTGVADLAEIEVLPAMQYQQMAAQAFDEFQ